MKASTVLALCLGLAACAGGDRPAPAPAPAIGDVPVFAPARLAGAAWPVEAEKAVPPFPQSRPVLALEVPATSPRPDRRPPPARVEAANRAALQEPRSEGFVNAVQVYAWVEGAVYRVYAAPGQISDIALQPGEALTSVAAGDTVRWIVGDTSSGSGAGRRIHVLIKPTAAGLRTNLVINTSRRSYHLQVESTARTAMAAISWTYPQDPLLALDRTGEADGLGDGGLELAGLRFRYEISGDRPSWRPLRAFDDGRQVYIEFPAGIGYGEAPPLFVLGEGGAPELVNYRISGRFYIVDRLFGRAELRLGGRRQQIVRIDRSDAPDLAPRSGRRR